MKKPVIIHPILFALFPILFVFSHNIGQIPPAQLVVPLVITLCITFILWFALRLVIKDRIKTGLLLCVFLIMFFSYLHINALLDVFTSMGVNSVVELKKSGRFLGIDPVALYSTLTEWGTLAVWVILLLLFAYLILKSAKPLVGLNAFLNATSVALILITVGNISVFYFKARTFWRPKVFREAQKAELKVSKMPSSLPDIYYIILDGYAREDVLKEIYGYDNSQFLEQLKQRGFYIADKSCANYAQTCLSNVASLNFSYLDSLDELSGLVKTESGDRLPLQAAIDNNRAVQFLKQFGYVFVALSSGRECAEVENADIFIAPPLLPKEFYRMIINYTPFAVLLDKLRAKSDYDIQRERHEYVFEHIASLPKRDFPVFLFSHILAPHPPFVFDEDGQSVEWPKRKSIAFCDGSMIVQTAEQREEYMSYYVGQLRYLNKRVIEIIDGIIANSTKPPIIILQADHGPGSMLDWESLENTNLRERMSILNAYFLPDGGEKHLYGSITPVNTFRVIFNAYFGASFELLDDKSYFSRWSLPYQFVDVTEKVK